MVRLTFYGGVGEVGGNKILLEDGETSLFFDFGTSFHRRSLYFEEFLNPRPGAGLLDAIEMGLLPPLEGLYRDDLIADANLWQRYRSRAGYRSLPPVDALLLSHAHLDHSGYISFLKPDIPVYTTAMTAFVAKAIQDTGKSDIEHEVCYLVPKEYAVPKGDTQGALQAADWHKVPALQRPFRLFDRESLSDPALAFWQDTPGARALTHRPPVNATDVGRLKLRRYEVDHSIFGATAFAVETSDGWVVYSGDLRMHGGRGRLTERFIEQAALLRPTALLCEGTRVDGSALVTEAEVFERCLAAAREARGLIVADFGPRNIERLVSFHRVAQETGRQLVILPRDAYLLDAMRLLSSDVPDCVQDTSICLYYEGKATTQLWERKVRERYRSKLTTPQDVGQRQDSYILCFSFFDVNELPSITPREGSVYIYSSSEVYDEEQAIDVRRLHNWLNHFGMHGVGLPTEVRSGNWQVPEDQQGFHASGHASGPELIDMIRAIRPKMLIPIHTEKPEVFVEALRGSGIEVRLPKCALDAPLAECAIELS